MNRPTPVSWILHLEGEMEMGTALGAVSSPRWFAVEHVEEVTVLRFTRPEMGDEESAQAIGLHLFNLVDNLGRRRFVLNFSSVHRLTSSLLGKLITFQKKVKQAGGHLVLCSLTPEL